MQSIKLHIALRTAHIYRLICTFVTIPIKSEKMLKNTRLLNFVEVYIMIIVLSNVSQIFNGHDCTRYSVLAHRRRIKQIRPWDNQSTLEC